MFNYLLAIDLQITHLINSLLPHNQFFDKFFSFFSMTGSSFLIWVIIIILVIIFEEIMHPGIQKRDIKFVVIFLLTFALTFVVSDLLLKNIFQRTRPFNPPIQLIQPIKLLHQIQPIQLIKPIQPLASVCPHDFSFPSTHAATAFASATVLAFFDKKRKWFYYAVAILISLSRIYLNCHYFGDVVMGGFMGFIIGNLLIRYQKLFHFKSP